MTTTQQPVTLDDITAASNRVADLATAKVEADAAGRAVTDEHLDAMSHATRTLARRIRDAYNAGHRRDRIRHATLTYRSTSVDGYTLRFKREGCNVLQVAVSDPAGQPVGVYRTEVLARRAVGRLIAGRERALLADGCTTETAACLARGAKD